MGDRPTRKYPGCRNAIAAILICSAITPRVSRAIGFGQLDDFSSGTAGWSEGFSSPNPPTVIASGGPGGATDPYLLNNASGGFGAGSKQIMFNTAQWAGDYNAVHITRIDLKLKNFGATALPIRIAFTGSFDRFASTNAFSLPANSGWVSASFDLSAAALTNLGGAATVAQGLSSVSELRILAAATPAYNGDGIVSSLGVDGIRALRQPGDATFDGKVEFGDLVVLAQNYNSNDADWATGDFNFDHAVNFEDLVVLAQNYNAGVPANAIRGDVGGASFSAEWARALALVPEPGVAPLLAGGLAGARRGRRRSTSGARIAPPHRGLHRRGLPS